MQKKWNSCLKETQSYYLIKSIWIPPSDSEEICIAHYLPRGVISNVYNRALKNARVNESNISRCTLEVFNIHCSHQILNRSQITVIDLKWIYIAKKNIKFLFIYIAKNFKWSVWAIFSPAKSAIYILKKISWIVRKIMILSFFSWFKRI